MLAHNFAATLIKRKEPKMLVFTRAHGFDLYFERSPVAYLPFKKQCFDALDAIFFISQNGKEYFKKTHHIDERYEKKLFINRLGTSNDKDPRIHINKGEKSLRIVSNSWLLDFKRVELIVDVLSGIKDLKINWTYFGGNSKKESVFNHFVSVTERKFLEMPNISFTLKGSTMLNDIFQFYDENDIDVFLHLSAYEGLPVAMMEVMSFGVPVISTNVGGVSEIVKDNFNGFLLSPNPSIDEVKAVLKKFAELTPAEYAQMRQNAYDTWLADFNAERNAKQLLDDMNKFMNLVS